MILKLLKRFIRLFARQKPGERPIQWPTKEEILELPPFEALELPDIVEVLTPEDARRAHDELMREHVVGFDTESKPVFVKGQKSTGPHVAQFSTTKRAYIFMLYLRESRDAARDLIASESLKKVGFGLSGDLRQIRERLRIEPKSVLDLETLFREQGHGRGVGAKVGVAIALKKRFYKSKKASTSNWMNRRLSPKQLLYAGNDAYAAIKVFHALARAAR